AEVRSLARYARALELVQVGPAEPFEHALEVGDVAAVHEPYERGLIVLDIGGYTEYAVVVDALRVLFLHALQRPAAPRLFGDGGEIAVVGERAAVVEGDGDGAGH